MDTKHSFLETVLFLNNAPRSESLDFMKKILLTVMEGEPSMSNEVGATLIQAANMTSCIWMQALVLFVVPGNAIVTKAIEGRERDREKFGEFMKRLPKLQEECLQNFAKDGVPRVSQFLCDATRLFLLC